MTENTRTQPHQEAPQHWFLFQLELQSPKSSPLENSNTSHVRRTKPQRIQRHIHHFRRIRRETSGSPSRGVLEPGGMEGTRRRGGCPYIPPEVATQTLRPESSARLVEAWGFLGSETEGRSKAWDVVGKEPPLGVEQVLGSEADRFNC